MSDEIKERPDKPGIWQSDLDVALYEFLRSGSWRYYGSKTEHWGEQSRLPTANRWRQIVDADGKQVCDPEKPWPPKTRIEKRRVIIYRDGGFTRVDFERLHSVYQYFNTLFDEIRDCEIGEDGKVVRVIPKEGER